MKPIDLSSVITADDIKGDDEAESVALKTMLKQATAYLKAFKWCSTILESYLGIGVAKVIAVFLFRIQPAKQGVDEWVWVVVGDVPPAYIATDYAANPACALKCYIAEVRAWVKAVKSGQPTGDLIPVNAPATFRNAEELSLRLDFLKEQVLIHYTDDLKA